MFQPSDCSKRYARTDSTIQRKYCGGERLASRNPLRPIWSRIPERESRRHHVGDEPAGHRAERQPPRGMAVGKPQPGLARGAADHRARIRKAGARADPGLILDRVAEGKQVARGRQHAAELDRRRRSVAGGKFSAGGDADALLHGRNAIAVVSIENRPRQTRVAARTEVAVIAALDGERQIDAERTEQIGRPRPERHHGDISVDRALYGVDPPPRTQAVQAARVPRDGHAAERRKTCRIGSGESEWGSDAGGVLPEDGMAEYRRHGRLQDARVVRL